MVTVLIKTPREQARHTRIVTSLMMSSCGDLMLNGRGNLTTRNVRDANEKELPWALHTPGEKLADITSTGWALTRYGAQYILENSIFEARDRKFLTDVARGLRDRNGAED